MKSLKEVLLDTRKRYEEGIAAIDILLEIEDGDDAQCHEPEPEEPPPHDDGQPAQGRRVAAWGGTAQIADAVAVVKAEFRNMKAGTITTSAKVKTIAAAGLDREVTRPMAQALTQSLVYRKILARQGDGHYTITPEKQWKTVRTDRFATKGGDAD